MELENYLSTGLNPYNWSGWNEFIKDLTLYYDKDIDLTFQEQKELVLKHNVNNSLEFIRIYEEFYA